MASACVDFGCVTVLHRLGYLATHQPYLDMVATAYALLICFSLARRHSWHVLFSGLLACACFTFVVVT